MPSNKFSSSQSSAKGLVQIFTGNGRGKTSAALGTVMRASGYGLKTYIIFFLKGRHDLGEYKVLSQLPNVDWAIFGRNDFFGPSDATPKDRELTGLALASARKALRSGQYDLVVLDEVNTAAAWGFIELEDVVRLIKEKPSDVELILTGRYADVRLFELADLVTEMVSIKHPYDEGMGARRGIDY